jgi:RNA recognition motif-containing protein
VSIKLFVGSLPLSFNENNLKNTFKVYGTVLSAIIAKDSHTGHSRGFGYVEMKTQSAAKNAINALNGSELKGRYILVDQAHLTE